MSVVPKRGTKLDTDEFFTTANCLYNQLSAVVNNMFFLCTR